MTPITETNPNTPTATANAIIISTKTFYVSVNKRYTNSPSKNVSLGASVGVAVTVPDFVNDCDDCDTNDDVSDDPNNEIEWEGIIVEDKNAGSSD